MWARLGRLGGAPAYGTGRSGREGIAPTGRSGWAALIF